MCYIDAKEQIVDIFTKALDKSLFVYLQSKMYGCWYPLLRHNGVLEHNSNSKRDYYGSSYLEMTQKRFCISKHIVPNSHSFYTVFTCHKLMWDVFACSYQTLKT